MSAYPYPAQLAALRNRARTGLLACLVSGTNGLAFWRAQLKTISMLEKGTAAFLAARDAQLPYQPPRGLQAAWAALPEGAELLPVPEVVKILRAEGIELAPHAVAALEVGSVQQLEDSVVAAGHGHDEHAGGRVELQDGAARHEASVAGESASIAQAARGAA